MSVLQAATLSPRDKPYFAGRDVPLTCRVEVNNSVCFGGGDFESDCFVGHMVVWIGSL